jgi:hypothetical protein
MIKQMPTLTTIEAIIQSRRLRFLFLMNLCSRLILMISPLINNLLVTYFY